MNRLGLFIALSIAIIAGIILIAGTQQIDRGTPEAAVTTVTLQPTETKISLTPDMNTSPTRVGEGWMLYENEEYGFRIQYPSEWERTQEEQYFQSGDIFSVLIVGLAQTEGTEFFDGARLAVTEPIETDMELREWIDERYANDPTASQPPEINEEIIGGMTFVRVYTCGLGCFDHYHFKQNGVVYGIVTFAAGDKEDQYRETLEQMLQTFELTSST